jgi:membrane associated rhomboid family serine protease
VDEHPAAPVKGVQRMHYGSKWGIFSRTTPAVKYLILANSGVFLLTLLFRLEWLPLLGLSPALFWRGYFWQPFSYMFLHGGIFHLFFNMLVLWMFGTTLESTWGPRKFLTFYFVCGVGAGLLNAAVTPASPVPIVGSSGAIYGLLMAFGILFPQQLIYIWGIFPVKAKYFVIGIGLIEFLTAMSATRSGIAHFAHLGGMLFGLLYMKGANWRRALSGGGAAKRRARHLKVVWDREREKQNLQKEIDRILDKAGEHGIDSLTAEEHVLFKKLSDRIAELEKKE